MFGTSLDHRGTSKHLLDQACSVVGVAWDPPVCLFLCRLGASAPPRFARLHLDTPRGTYDTERTGEFTFFFWGGLDAKREPKREPIRWPRVAWDPPWGTPRGRTIGKGVVNSLWGVWVPKGSQKGSQNGAKIVQKTNQEHH